MKCNVSFLCISEYPRDFIKCSVFFLCTSEYLHEFNDLHKDYVLLTARLQIEENILNNYQRHLLWDEGFSKPPSKLASNLRNKTNYIIHYCNLKLHLELRLHLTNIHRVLSFDQSPWLKKYKNFNTRQRTTAKNDLEKNFFKLMNEAVFGRSFLFLGLFVLIYWFTIHWLIHCG